MRSTGLLNLLRKLSSLRAANLRTLKRGSNNRTKLKTLAAATP